MADAISGFLAPPTNEEELQALAERLRGKRRGGQMFSLSGDEVMQKAGQASLEAADQEAERAGILRDSNEGRKNQNEQNRLGRALESQRITEQQRTNQLNEDKFGYTQEVDDLKRMGVGVETTPYQLPDGRIVETRINEGVRVFAQDGPEQDLRIPDGAKPWKEPTARSGSGSYKPTAKQKEANSKNISYLATMQTARDTFKPEFGNPYMVPIGGIMNTVENWTGMTPEGREGAAGWHGLYEKELNIEERHDAFGAALTKTEKPLWERATITANTNPAYVAHRLDIQERLMRRTVEKEVRRMQMHNVPIEQIMFEYGEVVPNLDDILMMSSGEYSQYREDEAADMHAMMRNEEGPNVKKTAAGGDGRANVNPRLDFSTPKPDRSAKTVEELQEELANG